MAQVNGDAHLMDTPTFIYKVCVKCGKKRKFKHDAPNEPVGICGECFDWSKLNS